MRYQPSTYRRVAAGVFVVAVVFLGTSGVQFVFEGNSKGEPGFVAGIVLVLAGVHQLMRAKKAEAEQAAKAAASSGRRKRRRR